MSDNNDSTDEVTNLSQYNSSKTQSILLNGALSGYCSFLTVDNIVLSDFKFTSHISFKNLVSRNITIYNCRSTQSISFVNLYTENLSIKNVDAQFFLYQSIVDNLKLRSMNLLKFCCIFTDIGTTDIKNCRNQLISLEGDEVQIDWCKQQEMKALEFQQSCQKLFPDSQQPKLIGSDIGVEMKLFLDQNSVCSCVGLVFLPSGQHFQIYIYEDQFVEAWLIEADYYQTERNLFSKSNNRKYGLALYTADSTQLIDLVNDQIFVIQNNDRLFHLSKLGKRFDQGIPQLPLDITCKIKQAARSNNFEADGNKSLLPNGLTHFSNTNDTFLFTENDSQLIRRVYNCGDYINVQADSNKFSYVSTQKLVIFGEAFNENNKLLLLKDGIFKHVLTNQVDSFSHGPVNLKQLRSIVMLISCDELLSFSEVATPGGIIIGCCFKEKLEGLCFAFLNGNFYQQIYYSGQLVHNQCISEVILEIGLNDKGLIVFAKNLLFYRILSTQIQGSVIILNNCNCWQSGDQQIERMFSKYEDLFSVLTKDGEIFGQVAKNDTVSYLFKTGEEQPVARYVNKKLLELEFEDQFIQKRNFVVQKFDEIYKIEYTPPRNYQISEQETIQRPEQKLQIAQKEASTQDHVQNTIQYDQKQEFFQILLPETQSGYNLAGILDSNDNNVDQSFNNQQIIHQQQLNEIETSQILKNSNLNNLNVEQKPEIPKKKQQLLKRLNQDFKFKTQYLDHQLEIESYDPPNFIKSFKYESYNNIVYSAPFPEKHLNQSINVLNLTLNNLIIGSNLILINYFKPQVLKLNCVFGNGKLILKNLKLTKLEIENCCVNIDIKSTLIKELIIKQFDCELLWTDENTLVSEFDCDVDQDFIVFE